MARTNHAYRIGVEEEFFLADARTRGTPGRGVMAFHAAAKERFDEAEHELLQSQIEVCTPPTDSVAVAGERLRALRSGLGALARERGLLLFAAGTHPTARWRGQRETQADRYQGIMRDLRMIGQRSVVSGMHVHVEVARPEARTDLKNRLLPFLPALLALSVSSPFWQGQRTGLCGYRLRAYAELPRTGLPELFDDAADYERYVRVMTGAGAIEDASFLWWHLRASIKFPTLELRVADACTRLDDALCIAALFRCLVRLVERDARVHARLTGASRGFVMENLWRAERDGTRAELIDEAAERARPLAEHVEALLAATAEDAEALGCRETCEHARVIVAKGTSADRQTAVFDRALQAGASEREALSAVVDALAEETAPGAGGAPEAPARRGRGRTRR